MSNEERIRKYKEEICKNCINRNTNLCDIAITIEDDKIIKTKCNSYKSEINNKKN